MDFESDASRMLFLKYALPCADTLVKRGAVPSKLVRDTISSVSKGKIIGNPERMFKTAHAECERIAKRNGKMRIGPGAIRRYFLFDHDKVVDRRYGMFKDFDPTQCRVFSGRIIRVAAKEALIETIIGKKKYRTDFIDKPKAGDYVTVHRKFAIERISQSVFKKLWKQKETYFNSVAK